MGAVVVNADGQVDPGNHRGVLNTGDFTMSAGAELVIDIAGVTAGQSHDQLKVTGQVSLDGTLDLVARKGFSPALGDSFEVIDNVGSDAVTGAFDGLAEGAIYKLGSRSLQISYKGGDGNDVVLTTVTPGQLVLSNASVKENSAGGTVVGALSVTLAAGDVSYVLGQNPTGAFAIKDNQIGVANGAALNFESRNSYTITVKATDEAGTEFNKKFVIGIQDVLETPKGTAGNDTLIGDVGANQIHGRDGDDVIRGMGGNDWLWGDKGRDKLTGDAGADVFVLGKNFGNDTVTDFDRAEKDRINLKDAVGIDSFRDLMRHHAVDRGSDVLITADDGSSFLLKHVELQDLKSGDFMF